MKMKSVLVLLVVISGIISAAPLCWAKETSYNYVIAYSYRDKTVYHSPIFTRTLKGVSYNEEEYVSDTGTLLKMESNFQKHLKQQMSVNSPDMTVSARVAFKTEDIAKRRFDKEVDEFRFRGFEIKAVTDFKDDK